MKRRRALLSSAFLMPKQRSVSSVLHLIRGTSDGISNRLFDYVPHFVRVTVRVTVCVTSRRFSQRCPNRIPTKIYSLSCKRAEMQKTSTFTSKVSRGWVSSVRTRPFSVFLVFSRLFDYVPHFVRVTICVTVYVTVRVTSRT